jgi:glycosyltransferase involved in cell wall biosynthesis
MPCFNEEATVRDIVTAVFESPLVGEIVAVDDASTDATPKILAQLADEDSRISVHVQPVNRGKGAALRRGFEAARLPYVIVQDADLEYDPAEYDLILAPLLDGVADVVYGSRFKGGHARRVLYFWHTVGNRLLTLASNVFTNLNLTDMETCHKAFRREALAQLTLEEDRFGIEPEITAKVARAGLRVYEVGIAYRGRTYAEGKKIGWRDGIRAFFCIVAYSPLGERVRLKRVSPVIGWITGGQA